MKPTDLTVKILTEIRDAVRETNSRIDQTNSRIDQTNSRIDQTNSQLEGTRVGLSQRIDAIGDRITESEIRTATAIMKLSGTLEDVKSLLRERLDLSDRVDRCESDIQTIKVRIGIG
ncbi:MAG: hypothetical protein HY816_18210 [Candidatus Wallbacteria bacterium]|nr:hypothetical protein [Candidatus Wallbacteria bacterium]